MKKCIAGLLLLAFAVPSWAEDDVWYCVDEHVYKLEDVQKVGVYKLERYRNDKFTLKYEADKNRLAIVGRTWNWDEPYYLDCAACFSLTSFFQANDTTVMFNLTESRFFWTQTTNVAAKMTTGTCTKF